MAGELHFLTDQQIETLNRVIRRVGHSIPDYANPSDHYVEPTANDPTFWIDWKNTDSTDCPPYGFVEIYDFYVSNSVCVLLGRQFTGSDVNRIWGLNNNSPVSQDEFGKITFDETAVAAYDKDCPQIGDSYGGRIGQWEVSKDGAQARVCAGIFDPCYKWMYTIASGNAISGDGSVDGTTTTTPFPPTTTFAPCAGTCKYTWNAGSNTWELTTNGCSEPTTSTTTTSTTTPDPNCICPTSTTSTAPPTTTTSTTTTPAPCHCLYPDFCGDTNGQCTHTSCTRGIEQISVDCTTSTTTTTTTTTSTTPTPDCTLHGCDYVWLPYIGDGGWYRTNIEIPACSGSAYGGCQCPIPNGISNPPDGNCSTLHLDCVPPPPIPPQSDPSCGGTCLWGAIPVDNKWLLINDGCPFVIAANETCLCAEPTITASNCGTVSTPCVSNKHNPNPTSTTPNPCGTGCIWTCDGTDWHLHTNSCSGGCSCLVPAEPCTDTCLTALTPCLEGTTTTTSSPTTTTSTTTTTTTTTTTSTTTTTTTTTMPPPCSAGSCVFDCVDYTLGVPGSGVYQITSSTCDISDPGPCSDLNSPGMLFGCMCDQNTLGVSCSEGDSLTQDCNCGSLFLPPTTTPHP